MMQDFNDRLTNATSRISATYFQLPVAGRETPIYRERVYCYELYHQLRLEWPEYGYFLSGETDKSGHPVIRDGAIAQSKPDFLIHIPEDMDNFAAIEVKPINGALGGIKKDLQTLLGFLDHARYQRAIYLIYGAPKDGNALLHATRLLLELQLEKRIELWHHAASNSSAIQILVETENS